MIATKQINDLSRPANGWFHIEKSGDHDVDYGEGPAVLRVDDIFHTAISTLRAQL